MTECSYRYFLTDEAKTMKIQEKQGKPRKAEFKKHCLLGSTGGIMIESRRREIRKKIIEGCMMRKSADVLEIIDKDSAKVMLYKHKKCHGCGSCNKHMHPGSIFVAANPAQAKKGEMVDVNVHKRFSVHEFAIAYLLPVFSFFGGLLLGDLLFSGKGGGIGAVGLAFLLLTASIILNVIYKKNYHPVYTVSIIKRIEPAEPRL